MDHEKFEVRSAKFEMQERTFTWMTLKAG